MRAFVIYGLFDTAKPDEIRYVGKTCQQPRVRLVCHLSSSLRERATYKDRWICKTLEAGGTVEMCQLARAETLADANRIECEQIAFLRAAGARLTNATDGGDGGLSHVVSPEHRHIISQCHKGIPKSQEVRDKISAALTGRSRPDISARLRGRTASPAALANLAAGRAIGQTKGRPKSAEQRAKLRIANLGKTLSPETREKIRQAHKGRVFSETHLQNLLAARHRRMAAEGRNT